MDGETVIVQRSVFYAQLLYAIMRAAGAGCRIVVNNTLTAAVELTDSHFAFSIICKCSAAEILQFG